MERLFHRNDSSADAFVSMLPGITRLTLRLVTDFAMPNTGAEILAHRAPSPGPFGGAFLPPSQGPLVPAEPWLLMLKQST